jgi:hypothetical protein
MRFLRIIIITLVIIHSVAYLFATKISDPEHINTKVMIHHIRGGLVRFYTAQGFYPHEDKLSSLFSNPDSIPNWDGPYNAIIHRWFDFQENRFLDAWKNRIKFNHPSIITEFEFDLYSFGKDGVDDKGKGDDIVYGKKINLRYYGKKPFWYIFYLPQGWIIILVVFFLLKWFIYDNYKRAPKSK